MPEQTWEHLTVAVSWNRDQRRWQSDWSEDYGDGPTCDSILDAVSAAGWELVSFLPYLSVVVLSPLAGELDERYASGTHFWAIFKRRKA
ncbi:MAG TPA: hypothetical protein VFU60_07045 [Ktedonobacterales bacterium]|nr:hypothetical protein [Ktedonobacterales bacterium]